MTCSAHPGMPLLTECSSLTSRLGEPISLMRTLRLRGVGRRLRPGDLTPWPLPFAGRPIPKHLWLPRSDTELRGKEDMNWRGRVNRSPLVSFQTAEEGPGWDQREILPPAAGWAGRPGLAGLQPRWLGGASLGGSTSTHSQVSELS